MIAGAIYRRFVVLRFVNNNYVMVDNKEKV